MNRKARNDHEEKRSNLGTAIFQIGRRLREFLLLTQKTDRIMAGQNHQSRTLSPIMILSRHDSVLLGCDRPCGVLCG